MSCAPTVASASPASSPSDEEELAAALKAAGARTRRRGRGRRRRARSAVTALLGGTFNPPHNGHVELAHAASRAIRRRGRRAGRGAAGTQGRATRRRDAVSSLRAPPFPTTRSSSTRTSAPSTRSRQAGGAIRSSCIGADEFCDFLTWKDPEGVLDRARLAVATRPGFPRERFERVLEQLSQTGPRAVLRDRAAADLVRGHPCARRCGRPIDDLVPPAVAELIEARAAVPRGLVVRLLHAL